MEFIALLAIAISLSFDSFAVSISCGLNAPQIRLNSTLKLAFIFALVQGGCFFTGCIMGQSLRGFISSYDHWVAFSILLVIGGKMIYESLTPKTDNHPCASHGSLKLSTVLFMAIATSIDAIIVGLGIALTDLSIKQMGGSSFIIALITGITVIIGLIIGRKTGKHIGGKAEIIGGIVLICIGLKILVEHLS